VCTFTVSLDGGSRSGVDCIVYIYKKASLPVHVYIELQQACTWMSKPCIMIS